VPEERSIGAGNKLAFRDLDKLSPDKLDVKIEPKPSDLPTRATWEGHTEHVRGVAFSVDGKFVISVSGDVVKQDRLKPDKSIRVWDARRGEQVHILKDFEEALDAVSVSPGGRFAVFGHCGHWRAGKWVDANDHNVHMWDVQERKEIGFGTPLVGKGSNGGAAQAEPRFQGLRSSVFSTAFSRDGERVIGADNKGTVVLWKTATGEVIQQGRVPGVARLRSDTGRVRQLRVDGVDCIHFTPDDRWLMTSGWDYTVRLWDARTCELAALLESHQDIVWAVATWGKAGRLLGLSGGGWRLSLGGDGFVAGARDYAIRLWNLETHKELRSFTGHGGLVSSLVFCPDGRHFVSASEDRTVRLWDLESGRQLRLLGRHEDGVRSAAVSPDGRSCVSGGDDCKVRFWRLPTKYDLIEALDRNNATVLQQAAEDMDVIGRDALEVFPRLVKGLGHGEPPFRRTAAQILMYLAGSSGPKDLPFDRVPVSDLVKALEGDSPVELKVLVARGLGNIGPGARDAVPVLLQLARGKDAAQAIPTVAEALGKIGENTPEVVGLLQMWLEHREAAVRLQALLSLHRLGPDALKPDSLLERLQKDSDKEVRAGAERIFRDTISGLTRADLPVLRKALASPQAGVCIACANHIASFGAYGSPAIPELTALLARPERDVRLAALRVLPAVSKADKSAVPALVKLIDPQADKRTAVDALLALNQIEPQNRALRERGIPLLMDQLLDPEKDVRLLSEGALGQIGPKAVMPLTFWLVDDNPNRRSAAASALGRIGPAAERAIPDLQRVLLEDDKRAVRREAAEALGRIGPKALPVLHEQLSSPEEFVRQVAAVGLGAMGPAAKPAIPALKRLSGDRARAVSRAALSALEKIDPDWDKRPGK
jgi:WD40 repeat protein